MERGEVEDRDNSWASWKTTKPDWAKEKKIIVMRKRVRAGSDAPSVEQMAATTADRRIMELVLSGGISAAPSRLPGVPEPRATALRAAFDAVMKDPDFRTEAAALQLDVAPVDGASLQRIVEDVVSTPKELATRAKHFLE